MATLMHSRIISPPLDSSVPTPFPRERLAQIPLELSKGKAVDKVVNPFEGGSAENPFENEVGLATLAESGIATPNTYTLKEVLPSINHVQKTCLMTLNNLLSERIGWHPIVPPRRHSMPSTPIATSFEDDSNLPFALHTLVSNLRDDTNAEMIEIATDDSEANLLQELRMRVHSLSPSLSLHAAALTKALMELLINLHQLSNIQANVYHLPTRPVKAAKTSDAADIPPPIDVFDRLTRQLGDLRSEHLSSQSCHPTQELSSSDLWSRIDADLENVVALCKQRVVTLPKSPHDVPPQYDNENYDDLESLPDYDAGGRTSLEELKSQKPGTSQVQPAREDEKMRMDLESVAIAIERLYLVAPQLHNQRVELKSSKLAELEGLERARAAASRPRTPPLRNCEDKDVRELEQIIDMIGKASSRTMIDQSVILDGSMRSRIHKAKQKDSDKRNAFVDQLFQHSEAGRIHNQDAELQVKDPEALLTLPEFMREALPQSERSRDGEALLSLPEFVREPIPAHISSKMSKKADDSAKQDSQPKKRSRSLSAPPLAWLKSSASKTSPSLVKSNSQGFDIVYVAENHENLHHILLFFNIIGGVEADVQAEVMPLFLNLPMDGGDHLFIKSGPHTSLPLMLPAHTNAGKKEVRPQRGHYEIKLMTRRPFEPPSESTGNTTLGTSTPLLDASQLSALNPVSFVCTSCSLPLIQSTKIDCYRDLPSEHWAELVESWMCHSDQKLNDHVAKHGKKGFWPSPGQALVGGSYILFEEGAINAANFHISVDTKDTDDWHLARCLCGALIGRHQEGEFNSGRSKVYRVLKYAVRPVSPNSEPLKIPLSAFVVQDMMEFVQAHASYRFVVMDEEEEKPRILIWLFKPRIRLAYTSMRHHSIPKSANILAAKVLFKLLGPNERRMDLKSILDKYPGFPQAEYLSYPMSACRQIAGMLNDSNSAYPEGLRAMTGLEVGFLQRS